MNKINTHKWKKFIIGDLFDKCELRYKKEKFNKASDISTTQTEEFNLPLVNAKHNNNGIMYYGRSSDFDSETMTIDIVADGAASAGDVYAQPQKTGVLYNAYLIKPKFKTTEYILLYFSTVIQISIKKKFGYENKCTWDKVKNLEILLPINNRNTPDYLYMDSYMKNIMKESEKNIENIKSIDNKKNKIKIDSWQKFEISKLFTIKSPTKRNIKTYRIGNIPYVSSGSINNGIVSYLEPNNNENIEKGNCITVSPLDGSSFYQENDFIGRGGAGSAISLLYNENITKHSALFISAIIKISAEKFNYNDALTSDNLKFLNIKLPVLCNKDGSYFIDKEKKYSDKGFVPDWEYMENYMKNIIRDTQTKLDKLFGLNKEILKIN